MENAIPARDLVAFAAENAEDVNKLTRQFRDVMKLKVNVVQVDPNADPDPQPRQGQVNVPDFKGIVFIYLHSIFTGLKNLTFRRPQASCLNCVQIIHTFYECVSPKK